MEHWSTKIEEELTLLIKDWLKQQGRTQADLRKSLKAENTRMPALLEILKREHSKGGLPQVAAVLCKIESEWANDTQIPKEELNKDPFDQLDLILEELRD